MAAAFMGLILWLRLVMPYPWLEPRLVDPDVGLLLVFAQWFVLATVVAFVTRDYAWQRAVAAALVVVLFTVAVVYIGLHSLGYHSILGVP